MDNMRQCAILPLIIFALPNLISSQHPLPLLDNDWAESNQKVFLRDEVTNIYITMDEGDLDAIIADTSSNLLRNCTVRFANSVVDETVTSVGIRARGASQRGNVKFPWKLDFNEFVDRKFLGLEKMNLNSEVIDPTISRTTVAFDIFRSMGVAASRTAHVWLTINDGSKVQGVYNNVEQIDEEFHQAWFNNKNGDSYKCRYKDVGPSLRPLNPNVIETYEANEDYEEKRTGSYQSLFDFINFIKDADDDEFKNLIKDWINVDSFLRALAVNVAIGGWDSLWLFPNNYYLYRDEDTGLFEYLPWDLDNTFGFDCFCFADSFYTNWATRPIEGFATDCLFGCDQGENGPPLIHRILEISSYSFMLRKYVKDITSKHMHPAVSNAIVSRISNLLSPIVFTGSFSGPTMDYGFTNLEFSSGYEYPSTYQRSDTITWGLMPFIRERSKFIRDTYIDEESIFPPIIVNEVLAKNEGGIIDENGEEEDWIELYNDSDFEVDISGFFLTDRYGNPRQWEIPSGTVIGPRGFVLFWCDDDEDEGPQHTNFKLTKDGEGVYLYLNDPYLNILVSSIVFPELSADHSYGRLPDGGEALSLFDTPTPLLRNEPSELTLLVDGFLPENLVIHSVGATPNAHVHFIFSESFGSMTISDSTPCGGTILDLDTSITYTLNKNSDNNGRVSLFIEENRLPPGTKVQIVDVDTCETSIALSL